MTLAMVCPAVLARRWIGTPYVHQGALRGAGCDCLGLVRGVWAELYGEAVPPVPPYTPDWAEPQAEERLWHAANTWLVAKPLGAVLQGDVLLFRMRSGSVAKHMGLQGRVGSNPTFIHSYQGYGVRESALTAPWEKRIVARFSFPARA